MRVQYHTSSGWLRSMKSIKALLILAVVLLLPCMAQAGVASADPFGAVTVAHTVTGVVTDAENNEPIPGVNVVLRGTTTGATTDMDGRFSLTLPDGNGILVFSYVGFVTQEVPIEGRTTLNIALQPDNALLDEVVVTALGVERQRRAVSFSVAEVKGPELLQGGAPTAVTSLYGKATGINISSNVTGPTGGVNLTIRGNKSITGNNRPLIIVDGIPIQDQNSGYSTLTWDYSQRDLGTGINDINAADIESMSILKGATAAALYGAQAANGVVLITTKKGRKSQGLGIEFSSTVQADQLAFQPDFQNEYGAGVSYLTLSNPNDGVFELDPATRKRRYDRTSYSWGPYMDGQELLWWDGQMRSYSPEPDNFKSIFQTGSDVTNSVAVSNATDRAVYRIGYTRRDYQGMIPGVGEERNSFSLSSNLEISTKLSADIALNYYNNTTHNPPPKLYVGYDFPRSQKTSLWDQYYKDARGYQIQQSAFPMLVASEITQMNSLMWGQKENRFSLDKNRLVGSLAVTYDFADWLNLRIKAGTDLDNRNQRIRDRSTIPDSRGASGAYSVTKWQDQITYGEVLLSAQRQLSEKVNLDGLVGAASTQSYYSSNYVGTNSGLVVENWFSTNNSKNTPWNSASRAQERNDGIFGSATLSYDDFLFLTGTARNDWTSTLPPGSNSYFYPSLGLSFVFSEALSLPEAISYGQFRANYAEVGRGAARYQANKVYNYGNWEGVTINSFSTTVPPIGLLPERKKEFEFGLNMAFLDSRLGFDASFYHERNVDQIIDLGVAATSGASAITVNNGLMTNTGIEARLFATPIQTKNFTWDASVNLTRNRNEVVELSEGLNSLTLQNVEDNLFITANPGEPFGNIYGYDFLYNENGQRIIDADGYFAKDAKLSLVGNTTPDLLGGFINTFSYKNLSLTSVIDFRLGGDIISISNYYMHATGKLKDTLPYRDEASGGLPYYVSAQGAYVPLPSHTSTAPDGRMVYHDGIILDGVKEVKDASGKVTGYEKNSALIPVWDYYLTNWSWKGQGIYPQAVYDNSFVKMRELVLGWRVPSKLLGGIPVQNLNLSLVGRNLFFFYKNVPNIDPESSIGTAARDQGYEYAYWPSARSFGFRIGASF